MNMRRIQILSVLVIFAAGAAYADAPQKVGVVGSANASTFAVGQDKAKRPLKTGDDVFLNDTIETDAKGAAQVMFLDRSALTVNPNSKVTIDTFVYNPATSSGEMSLNSAKGAMRFIGGALSKKQPVNIKTPVATIGIRGGIANVGTNPQTGNTESVFVFGTEMTSTNANGETTTTTQMGSGFSVDQSGNQQPMSPSQVAANVGSFNANTVTGGTPGALSSEVDSRVDSSVGGGESSGGSGASGGGDGSGGGSGSSSGSNGESGSGSDNSSGGSSGSGDAGGSGGGTVLASDGADQGAAFGPDRMDNGSSGAEGALGDLPPLQNLTSDATQDNTREVADNTVNGDAVNLPDLPPQDGGTATGTTDGTGQGTQFPSDIQITDGTNSDDPDNTQNTDTGNVVPANGGTGGSGGGTGSTAGTTTVTYTHKGLFSVRDGVASVNLLGAGSNNLRVGVGGRLVGEFHDRTDNTTVSDAYIEVPASAGYTASVDGYGDSKDYTGFAYVSPNHAMTFYRFSEDAMPTKKLTILTGEPILSSDINAAASSTASSSYSTNGLTFYDFLPDVVRYESGTASGFGRFNYNIANTNIVSAPTLAALNTGTANLADNIGLVVDWTNGYYFTGHLNWGAATAGGRGGMISAFGKVNSYPGSGSVLSGGFSDFRPHFNYSGTQYAESSGGGTRVKNDIYGKPVSGTTIIEGMLFESAKHPASALPENELFDPAINEYEFQGRQPVSIRTTAPVSTPHNNLLTSASNTSRNSGTYKGFAGGAIIQDEGTAQPNTIQRVLNSSADDVTITRDASGNSIGAKIKVTSQNTANLQFEGKFGSEASDPRQAYVRDQVYGIGQGNFDTINSGSPTAATEAKSGILASSATLANAPVLTNNQQYAHWGVWAAETKNSDGSKDVVNMVPYVAGEITPTAYTPAGNVSYTGGVLATKVTNSGSTYNDVGTFGMDINLGTRSVNLTSLSVTGLGVTGVTGSGSMHATDQVFQGIAISGGAGSGSMNGAVFGPTAENVGGNFNLDYSVTHSVTGVFIGQK